MTPPVVLLERDNDSYDVEGERQKIDFRIFDMTPLQRSPQNGCNVVGDGRALFSFEDNRTLHHFFRSLLRCRHCPSDGDPSHVTSPWGQYYSRPSLAASSSDTPPSGCCQNCVTSLLMEYGPNNPDPLTDTSLNDYAIESLLHYQVGDGSPSWYLHSVAWLVTDTNAENLVVRRR